MGSQPHSERRYVFRASFLKSAASLETENIEYSESAGKDASMPDDINSSNNRNNNNLRGLELKTHTERTRI